MLTPDDENQTNEKATRGRPSSFDKKYIKQAYELSLLGLTDEEMANVLMWRARRSTNGKTFIRNFRTP